MKTMKIALIGQSEFGKCVLEALAENGKDKIVGVFAPPTKTDKEQDPIYNAAKKLHLPIFGFQRLRDQKAISQFKSLEPELCVMAFVTDIVPMEIIQYPNLGTIQYHPSLLPLHRGPSSINWPIINGETETGLTIFWPDDGLDTGPVLMQKKVSIAPDATLGSVYFNKLFPLGVKAMVESVDLIRDGIAPRIAQDETKATYESWCKPSDVLVNWSSETNKVFNMIRGSDPQPGANTTYFGQKIYMFGAGHSSYNPSKQSPGTILEIGVEKIVVACSDGSISIGRIRQDGGKKISATEWAEKINLKVGDVLGS